MTEKAQFPVPEGWYTFGTHVDQPDVRLEFSDEVGEDGLPWWERPITSPGQTSVKETARD